ncbi:alkaline phosphatase [soil metagenome]
MTHTYKPALACLAGLVFAAVSGSAFAAGEARNVIFFLGDGMGPVTTTATRIKYLGETGSLAMDTMPYAARIKTFSKDGQTTDSAPSMAAYMTGLKTRNETLGMDGTTVAVSPTTDPTTLVPSSVDKCPTTGNGVASATLLELAIAKGKATGAVTTARLTHATPAATFAHTCHRNAEYEIARQVVPGGAGYNPALAGGVQVLMGGISQYFRPYNATTTPRGRPDGRDLVAELQAKGYTYVSDLASFNAAPATAGTKLIGLYDQAAAEGHMSYELDRNPALEPSLSQMATKAVDILSNNTAGFFLMVEGGRIDHALHGTNAARALADTKAFDDAIQAVIDKVKTFDPDLSQTLIVVTADHDHGMAFNGYGKRGTDILGPNISYVTGSPSKDVNGVTYPNLVFANGSNRPDVRVEVDPAVMAGKNYLQEVGTRRGTPGSETHGGGDVKLHAIGAGAAAKTFKGTLDNTAVFGLVKSAAGY